MRQRNSLDAQGEPHGRTDRTNDGERSLLHLPPVQQRDLSNCHQRARGGFWFFLKWLILIQLSRLPFVRLWEELPSSSPRWLSTLPSFPQSSPSLSLASALSLALSPPSSFLRRLDESYLILSGARNTQNSQQRDVELSETGRSLERSRVGWSSPG